MGDMSKETVLSKVEADLHRGDLGKARDRLHTLVYDYPNDVALRTRLAEVYHRLQFPAMAGRYWYLNEHRTPEMEIVVAAFERSCGGDPLLMLSALKFRGDPCYAGDRLIALRQAVQDKYEFFPKAYTPSRMLRSGRGSVPYAALLEKRQQLARLRPRMRGFIPIGRHHIHLRVAIAGVVIMALSATGLVSIGWWVYQAFQ
ncbi:MAG: DUF6584 family protein [Dehalococcoidia bacterium]